MVQNGQETVPQKSCRNLGWLLSTSILNMGLLCWGTRLEHQHIPTKEWRKSHYIIKFWIQQYTQHFHFHYIGWNSVTCVSSCRGGSKMSFLAGTSYAQVKFWDSITEKKREKEYGDNISSLFHTISHHTPINKNFLFLLPLIIINKLHSFLLWGHNAKSKTCKKSRVTQSL